MNTPPTDFLTGCLSKEAMDAILDKVKAECDIDKKPFSILVIDLDHFKTYNDKYGHLDGDDILKYFASTLRISLKETENFTFRFGGDEFIVVFPGKGGSEVLAIARSIAKIFRKRPFLSRGRIYNLSFSGGIASFPVEGREIEGIIHFADKAMYFSKTHGRGRTTLYKHILWENVSRVFLIIATIVLVIGTWLYFQQSSYKAYVAKWLKGRIGRVGTALVAPPPPQVYTAEGLDSIYLKSGRVIKGTVVREDKDEIELSLDFETGKGTITIKKSEIKNIERHRRKVPKS